jgi:hypothetical protein
MQGETKGCVEENVVRSCAYPKVGEWDDPTGQIAVLANAILLRSRWNHLNR